MPAAPAPLMTRRTSSSRLPTTRSALRSAASATIAVPCWSSWKTGMSSSLAQPGLDLEAARRGDVLEVDAGEDRGDGLDGADDLLGVGGVEADREGVDVGEPLEQRRLALHDRQRRERADVAEAEHGGAVGDDGDGVALDGQPPGVLGVLGDRQADPRDARGVDERQVVAGADRHLGLDRQLAAEVHEEGAVGDLADLDALDGAHRLDDLVGVVGVAREHRDVDAHPVVPRAGDVEAGDDAAGLLDEARHLADGRGPRREDEADGDAVGDRGCGGHGVDSTRVPAGSPKRRPWWRVARRPTVTAHVGPRGSDRHGERERGSRRRRPRRPGAVSRRRDVASALADLGGPAGRDALGAAADHGVGDARPPHDAGWASRPRWDREGQVVVGYTAHQALRLRVRDRDRVGRRHLRRSPEPPVTRSAVDAVTLEVADPSPLLVPGPRRRPSRTPAPGPGSTPTSPAVRSGPSARSPSPARRPAPRRGCGSPDGPGGRRARRGR